MLQLSREHESSRDLASVKDFRDACHHLNARTWSGLPSCHIQRDETERKLSCYILPSPCELLKGADELDA
jgi:hypothetical protein